MRSFATLAIAAAALIGSAAGAVTVYSESFDAAGFDPGGAKYGSDSERWVNTDYSGINNFNGWTFTGDTLLAQNSGTTSGALLLNERNPGGIGTVTIGGLTVGKVYTLSLQVFGDNRPGAAYVFNAALESVNVINFAGVDGAAGSNFGTTLTYSFAATGTSTVLALSQASPTDASPIVDNISLTAVPEPATWGLMLGGFGLVGYAARRRRVALTA